MTPSDHIKCEIADLAQDIHYGMGEFNNRVEIIERITKIVDEAVREAITITAKVLK